MVLEISSIFGGSHRIMNRRGGKWAGRGRGMNSREPKSRRFRSDVILNIDLPHHFFLGWGWGGGGGGRGLRNGEKRAPFPWHPFKSSSKKIFPKLRLHLLEQLLVYDGWSKQDISTVFRSTVKKFV